MTSGAERVCLGVVTGARGLRGDVRIKTFTADPRDLASYGPVSDEDGRRRFEIRVVGTAKGQLVARIEGIGDRTAAEALKGEKLYVDRAVLPELEEEEYYHADLVGLTVELVTGEELGTVRAVHDFGAGDVLDVAGEGKGSLMVPFTRDAVPTVDLEGGRVIVDPPPGLLEPATAPDEEGT